MLTLRQYIINNFANIEMPIRDIPNSICNSDLQVIDFNKLKIDFCTILNYHNMPSSCNCLYFKIESSRIVFIVMRDFSQALENCDDRFDDFQDFKDKLYKKLEKTEYYDKIVDSIDILMKIGNEYNTSEGFIYNSINYNFDYLIVTNISYDNYLNLYFDDLGYFLHSIGRRFPVVPNLIPVNDFDFTISTL